MERKVMIFPEMRLDFILLMVKYLSGVCGERFAAVGSHFVSKAAGCCRPNAGRHVVSCGSAAAVPVPKHCATESLPACQASHMACTSCSEMQSGLPLVRHHTRRADRAPKRW